MQTNNKSDVRKKIFTQTLSYSISQYTSQFIGFFSATFMRRFLGPFNMGIWSLLRLVSDYASYSHLGVMNVIDYKVPYLRGKGDSEEVEELKNNVFTFTLLATLVMSFCLVLFVIIFRNRLSVEMFWGLLAVSVLLFWQRSFALYVALLRAFKEFEVLSKSIIFDALINLVLVVTLIKRFGINGLFLTLILVPVLNILFIRFFALFRFKFCFAGKKIISYIQYGFPIFIFSLLQMFIQSIDKIMIAKFMGLESLGLYSIAIMAKTYSSVISKNFNIVIAPYFIENFGKNSDLRSMEKYIKIPAEINSYFMSIFLGIIYLWAPVFIEYVLPKFLPAVTCMRIILLSIFFFSLSSQMSDFIIIANKQIKLVVISSGILLYNIILNYFFIKIGLGITGVAIVASFCSFIMLVVYLFYSVLHFNNIKGAVGLLIRILIPLVYSIFMLILLDHTLCLQNRIVEEVLKTSLFLVAMLPLILHINRKYGLFALLLSSLKKEKNS